jgi:Ca2+-binding EF-hand superfamily protein
MLKYQFDQDNSGEINANEFQALYESARGEKLSDKRAKKALEAMDIDSTGKVSLNEFQAWWYATSSFACRGLF